MEFDSNQHSLHRLITLLESLFASTHQSKLSIEAHSREAQKLLHGWVLPEDESTIDTCRCAETRKQQLVAVLDRVGKAVKYSQCVREGRSDVSSPWPDEVTNNGSKKEEAKKSNSIKEVPAGKIGTGYNRDRFIKVNMTNGSSKKTGSNSCGIQIKSSSCIAEKQEQHSHLCPVHGGSPIPKNNPTVGLAEALDVKGIPPELVSVLKSVHQFINRLRTSNGKNRSESSFLRHLNAVNETRWNKIPSFSSLLIDLPSLTSNEHCGKIPMFEEENSLSKVAVSQSDNNYPFVGVWNPTIYSTLSVGAFCVQYQNEVIWNLLQMRIQQLQLAQAEWEVCNILSCDPLLCNPELQFSAAPLFLKAATALSRITTLNLPVLVKTFRDS